MSKHTNVIQQSYCRISEDDERSFEATNPVIQRRNPNQHSELYRNEHSSQPSCITGKSVISNNQDDDTARSQELHETFKDFETSEKSANRHMQGKSLADMASFPCSAYASGQANYSAPNAKAVSLASQEEIGYACSLMKALRAKAPPSQLSVANGNGHNDSQDEARNARRERKREINRQSAQRKRKRERDQFDSLTEKYNQLLLNNEKLKRERTEIADMIQIAKWKVVSTTEPASSLVASSSSIHLNVNASDSPQQKAPSPISQPLNLIQAIATCLKQPLQTIDASRTQLIKQSENKSESNQFVSNSTIPLLGLLQNSVQCQPVPPILPKSINCIPNSTNLTPRNVQPDNKEKTASAQYQLVMLLAIMLQGNPAMTKLLQEFVDNELKHQQLINQQQHQLPSPDPNNAILMLLLCMLQKSQKNQNNNTVQQQVHLPAFNGQQQVPQFATLPPAIVNTNHSAASTDTSNALQAALLALLNNATATQSSNN